MIILRKIFLCNIKITKGVIVKNYCSSRHPVYAVYVGFQIKLDSDSRV